jgi:hypothetical protein
MNAYATETRDTRRPHQKLNNYKPNHLKALWDELNSLYKPDTSTTDKEKFKYYYYNDEVSSMTNLIISMFSAFEIDNAHYNVIQRYGSQGIYRKGRKPGARISQRRSNLLMKRKKIALTLRPMIWTNF